MRINRLVSIRDITAKYWDNYNCAVSTACGITDYFEQPNSNIYLHSFVTFGAGFGEGSICGAVSGTIAAVSNLLHDRGYNSEIIKQIAAEIIQFMYNKFGHIECRELLAKYTGFDSPGRREQCTDQVLSIVDFIEDKINKLNS